MGDYVRLTGSDTVGEVTEVKGKKLQIISNSLKMTVDIDKTEPVDGAAYLKEMSKNRPQQKIDWSLNTRRNQFNSEIDVRGMRTEEALQKVQEFIDTAHDDTVQASAHPARQGQRYPEAHDTAVPGIHRRREECRR